MALAFDPTSNVLAVAASRVHERLQNELTSEVSLWNVATGEALDQDNQPTCRLGATPRYDESGEQ